MMMKPIEWHKMSNSLYVPDADATKKMNIVVGTRWSYFDFINYVLKELPDYKSHILSCFDDRGESTFPEKYTTLELQRIKDAQGPQMFSCQFLNNPLPGEIAVFKKEWLKYYEEIPSGMVLRKFLLVDPAISENKTADNRAAVVVGINEAKDWYILEYVRGIFPLIDDNDGKRNLVSEIFRLYATHEPSFVGIEEVGFQKALSFLMRQQFKQRQVYFDIRPLMPRNRQTKIMRIETLAAPFAAGRVYMKKDMHELEEELLGFPMARYRDLVDALSYLCQYEATPSTPIVKNNDPLNFDNILDDLKNKNSSPYPFKEQVGSL
jgi:phage terminase large subunit-like protein